MSRYVVLLGRDGWHRVLDTETGRKEAMCFVEDVRETVKILRRQERTGLGSWRVEG